MDIGSVITAEIFLIFTNVARINVAWTKVSATVEICSRCSQEPRFKVWSKSGIKQKRAKRGEEQKRTNDITICDRQTDRGTDRGGASLKEGKK